MGREKWFKSVKDRKSEEVVVQIQINLIRNVNLSVKVVNIGKGEAEISNIIKSVCCLLIVIGRETENCTLNE